MNVVVTLACGHSQVLTESVNIGTPISCPLCLWSPVVAIDSIIDSEGLDPLFAAVVTYVETMCDITVAQATGFHGAWIIESRRREARSTFMKEVSRLTQDKEG